MSEPFAGQCFSTTGLILSWESSCVVDVLDTILHVVFILVFGVWTIFRRNSNITDPSSSYHHNIGRWLISFAVIAISIASFMEGIITALTGRYQLQNASHLYIPSLLAVFGVLIALYVSCEMVRINSRRCCIILTFYWLSAFCGQLLRLSYLYITNRSNISTTRFNIAWMVTLLYFGLTVVEITTIYDINPRRLKKNSWGKYSVFDNEQVTPLSRLTYFWMRDVFSMYKSKEIKDILEDLGPMNKKYHVNNIQKTWIDEWQVEKESASNTSRGCSLWRIIMKLTGKNHLKAALFKLLADLLSYLGPITLVGIVHYTMEHTSKDAESPKENIGLHFVSVREYFQNGFVLMYFLFLIHLTGFVLIETHLFWTSIEGLKTQAGLQALIYQKSLRLWGGSSGQDHLAIGRLMNLVSVDAKCIYVSYTWCEVWAAPLRLFITFGILVQVFGISALLAQCIIIMLIPLQFVCGFFISIFQKKKKKYADLRSRLSNELFHSIKTIKALAWEDTFSDKISHIRQQELKYLFKHLLVLVFILSFTTVLPLFLTGMIFGLYSHLTGIPLTPAKAFLAVSLLNQLVTPLADFTIYMNVVLNAKVSINRILRFLESPERLMKETRIQGVPNEGDSTSDASNGNTTISEKTPLMSLDSERRTERTFISEEGEDDFVFKLQHGYFCTADETVLLRNIDVTIPRGGLTLLMGSVGSGKSSLLLALIEELTMTAGVYKGRHNLSSVAYCPQRADILNATLRENVLFGRPYDERRYKSVIEACCLVPDINILPALDETEIGERGINLSGGQKQRLSLARAIYSDKQTLLLDDPLSSLDVYVGRSVFDKAIGMVRKEGRTIILVVNNTLNCLQADHIIMMEHGTVKDEGDPGELIDRGIVSVPPDQRDVKQQTMEENIELERINLKILLQKEFSKDSRRGLTEKEDCGAGAVCWRVYLFYIRACSFLFVFLSAAIISIRAIFNLSANLWLAAWSEAGVSDTGVVNSGTLDHFVLVYLLLALSVAVCSFLVCYFLKMGSLKGAQKIHEAMLKRVIQAPSRFFDVNPLGRLLNRFTSDVNTADIRLDGAVTMAQYATVSVITAIVANAIVAPTFLVLTIPLALIFVLLFRKYLSLSMKLQRYANVSRSPVLAFLAESVGALTTVRAYRDQDRFNNIFLEKLESYTAVSFYMVTIQRWLAVRLDFLGTITLLLAGVSAMIGTMYFSAPVSYVGLSLAYSLQISYFLSQWVRSVSRLELCMNSIERIKSYCEIKTERYHGFHPEDDWPRKGSVKFNNVSVRYASHLDPVLRDINISIEGGQRVGICGRTGSGKSTLALTFLRFVDICNGYVTIDGLDIKSIPLMILRQRVAIIQQEAVLFSGTIRSNLDPFNVYKDNDLWRALHQVHLADIISKKTGLDTLVKDTGSNFSTGQRQLMCLARALLRNTMILVMDEATAAIDEETNNLVEQVVESEFQGKTVFTIVHHLEAIVNYDIILVLDGSRIAEAGPPDILLSNPDGVFRSMVQMKK